MDSYQDRFDPADVDCDADGTTGEQEPSPEQQAKDRARKDRKNFARRERHAMLTDLGLKRVKGALGGVYYE